MKAKTIRSVLKKVIGAWTNSIEDEETRQLVEENTIVTGGCIASMLLGEKINDYDIYFRTQDTALAVARYYVGKFNARAKEKEKGNQMRLIPSVRVEDERVRIHIQSAGIASITDEGDYKYFEADPDADAIQASEYIENAVSIVKQRDHASIEKYTPLVLTENAITLKGKIQPIVRFYGKPEEIHRNFDFVHCTNYWTSWDKELVLKADALESLLARDLRYIGSLYPVSSIMRMRKYVSRGWSCTAGQIIKIAWQVSKLDLEDYDVLHEQLIGVDVAYFSEILEKIRESIKEGEPVDGAYLFELIDKVF